jgi:hypothetical protein
LPAETAGVTAASAAAAASSAGSGSASSAAAAAAAAAAASGGSVTDVASAAASAASSAGASASAASSVAAGTAAAAAASSAGASAGASAAASTAASAAASSSASCGNIGAAASSAASAAGATPKAAAAAAAASASATCIYRVKYIQNVIVTNEPNTVTKKIIALSPSTYVDLETIRLGNKFQSNALLPLTDTTPFHIVGGHVSLNSPSRNLKIIAATITNGGIQHAVILDLKKTLDNVNTRDALYHTDLGQVISGTNPFTKRHDTVSQITDLLLWNNGRSQINFGDNSALTQTIIFK